MRKLVVIGAGGRLGKAVVRAATGERVIAGFDHAALDLGSVDAVRETLASIEFDALINTAALTNVDYCENHPVEAHRINSDGPCAIAQICAAKGVRMIHISTDYVFEGAAPGLRTEEDPVEPVSHYGASKLAGENAVLGVSPDHLVVRVSWVFGPDRPSFIDFILNEALTKDRAAAIGDKWSLPGYAPDLARFLVDLSDGGAPGGILHLCNTGPECSWQEYGQHALDCAVSHGMSLKTCTVEFQALASMHRFVARRPIHTALSTEKFTRLTGKAPRHWREAVDEFVRGYASSQA